MAKKDKTSIHADVAAIKDLLCEKYGHQGRAAIILLDDGKSRSCTIYGDGDTIFELLARSADHIIRTIGKNPESQISLAEHLGAMIPAIVRAKNGDHSVLDALMATVGADEDEKEDN